jgi:hypothetical protein
MARKAIWRSLLASQARLNARSELHSALRAAEAISAANLTVRLLAA